MDSVVLSGRECSIMAKPSGKFVIRMSSEMHGALRRAASAAHLSLNELCVSRLASAPSAMGGPFSALLGQVTSRFDEHLVGVAVFGSWARREIQSSSDIDLFIVLDAGAPI